VRGEDKKIAQKINKIEETEEATMKIEWNTKKWKNLMFGKNFN
jgi:hypothetical protein